MPNVSYGDVLTKLKCMKSNLNWETSGSIFLTVKEQDVIPDVRSGKSGLTKYVILFDVTSLQVAVTEINTGILVTRKMLLLNDLLS